MKNKKSKGRKFGLAGLLQKGNGFGQRGAVNRQKLNLIFKYLQL